MAGVVFGHLALRVTDDQPVLVTCLLSVWVAASGFVRMIPRWSYAGVVAGFSACIVALGYSGGGDETVEAYSMARIDMTCYGAVAWIVTVLLCFPVHEARRVYSRLRTRRRAEMMKQTGRADRRTD